MDNPFAPDGRWHPDPILLPEAESLTMRLEDGTPVRPPRQQLYHAEPLPEQVLKELMKRPGYGNQGKNIQLRLNSHVVSCSNEARIYQYAVSCNACRSVVSLY